MGSKRGEGVECFASRGVFAWLTTPLDERGALDPLGLRRNLQGYGGAPLAGYVLGGEPGEWPTLPAEQRQQMIDVTLQECGGRPVLVQVDGRQQAELDLRGISAIIVPWEDPGTGPWPTIVMSAQRRRIDPASWTALGGRMLAGLVDVPGVQEAAPPGVPLFYMRWEPQVAGGVKASWLLPVAAALPYEVCALWSTGSAVDPALADVLQCIQRGGPAAVKRAMDLLGYHGGPVSRGVQPLCNEQQECLVTGLRAAKLIRF